MNGLTSAFAGSGDQDTVLSVDDLSVQIAGDAGMPQAVKSLQLTIDRGQTFCLVGESGCGQSITALALLRLLPDSGRVSTRDRVVLGQRVAIRVNLGGRRMLKQKKTYNKL